MRFNVSITDFNDLVSQAALLEIKNLEMAADPMTVGSPSTLKFNATLQGSYF